MNSILADMVYFAAAYIDDIVIFSTNFEEQLNHRTSIYQTRGDRPDPEIKQM